MVESIKVKGVNISNLGLISKDKNIIYINSDNYADIIKVLSELGYNAYLHSKGQVAIPVSFGNEEKNKIKKYIKQLSENAKVSIRNIRKEARKEHDDKQVQKLTDQYISLVDSITQKKVNSL